MEFHPVDILISIINIIVLFTLLRVILWKHVNRYLTNRSARIKGEIDDASKLHKEAEALKAEFQQKIADYEEQGELILDESRQKANDEYDRIVDEAKAEADRIRRETEVRIEMDKQQALKDAQKEVAQLATEMAANILRREVSTDDNAHIVEDFFQK